MMRKNIKEGMAWLLISGLVTTSSGMVALANDGVAIITKKKTVVESFLNEEDVIYLTADMVSEKGIVVIEEGEWNCLVIPKELVAKQIKLKNVSVKKLVIESGTDFVTTIEDSAIEDVVVQAPKLEKIGYEEIVAMLASGKSATEVAQLYRDYQREKSAIEFRYPTIVTNEETKIDMIKVSGSVSLDLSKDNVIKISVETPSNSEKMKVEISNYTGDLSVKQEKAEKNSSTILNVTLKDSALNQVSIDSKDGTTCSVNQVGISKIEQMDIKGKSKVNLSVPVENVTIAKDAENAFVKLYTEVKEMVVEGTKSNIELASSAVVENAVVNGDNIRIYGYGDLKAADVTGNKANISTQGTKVEGENDTTVPSIIVTPEPTEVPVPTQTPVSPSPTETPVSLSPTQTPVSPSPTQTPVSPSPTETPVSPSPTETPVSPSPTQTPVSPSPTETPVSPSPTETPVSPSPTETPVSPSPTETPVSPSPTETPVSPSPTQAPSVVYYEVKVSSADVSKGTATSSALTVAQGEEVTLTATAKEGYLFERWVVNGIEILAEKLLKTPLSFIMGTSDVEAEAYFKEEEPEESEKTLYSISFSGDGIGMANTYSDKLSAETGSEVTITAVAKEGYVFEKWDITGVELTEEDLVKNPLIFTMGSSNVLAVPYFKEKVEEEPGIPTYTISVSTDETKGSVSTDKTSATTGTEVTVTAESKTGYQFSKWSVIGIGGMPTTELRKTPLTIVVEDSDIRVEAKFVEEDDLFLYTVEDNQATITGLKDTTLKEVVIPSEVCGYPVVAIGSNAFTDYTALEKVSMEESVISIGFAAFRGCTNLKSIELSENIISIDDYAFLQCSSLTSINIPTGVTSIGNNVFWKCSSLENVELSENITSIGNSAFRECSSLTNIEIPTGVTSIGRDAFSYCNSLTSIEIPTNVTSIGYMAFYQCGNLQKVGLNSSATTIEGHAFSQCTNLESIELTENVISIGANAFTGCSKLSGSLLLSNVESIGVSAFSRCSSLEQVELGTKITSIGSTTFSYCDNLTSITIPATVTSIEDDAFAGCDKLSIITQKGSYAETYADENGITCVTEEPEGPTYSISLSVDETMGSVIANRIVAEAGNEITITATAKEGYVFEKWNIEGIEVAEEDFITNPLTFTMGTSNVEVEAIFKEKEYSISFLVNEIKGSASADKTSAKAGSEVTITATANEGYVFEQWNIAGVEIAEEKLITNPLTFTMGNENVAVEPIFKEKEPEVTTYTISVSTEEIMGSVSVDKTSAEAGSEVTITATATAGYIFEKWDITGVNLTEEDLIKNPLTFTMGNADVVAKPCFKQGYTITLSVDETKGSIYADKMGAEAGTEITVTAEGMEGYQFSEWRIVRGTVSYSSNGLRKNPFTFTIASDVTIGVDFVEEHDLFFYVVKDNQATITGLKNTTSTEVVIPSEICGYEVVAIGEKAFKDNTTLKKISISKGITSIGRDAFEGCTSLTSVELPEGVTSIGGYAFRECTSLTSIELPESITSIETYVFYRCSSLKDVTLSENITSIEYGAFYGCSSLESIMLSDNITSIGDFAFRDCSKLTSIEMPKGVTSVGYYVFCGCSSLENVTLSDNITSIEDSAFRDCSKLTNIEIPTSVTSIKDYAFYGCSSLASIEVPTGLTSIGKDAFNGCSSLEKLVLNSSATSIGNYAFNRCTNLATIELGENVTSIGNNAFYNCSALSGNVLLSSVETIGDSAFESCSSLEAIKLGTKTTDIGTKAFTGCSSLVTIELGENVTNIGNHAFNGCSKLSGSLLLPSVETIGDYAFNGCSSLANIELGERITSIGTNVFYNCSNFTNIEIPTSVTSIGDWSFAECSNLTSIKILENVTNISSSAFVNCEKLSIIAPKDSYAETYANENGITYVSKE